MEISRAPLPRQPGGLLQDCDQLQTDGCGYGSAPAGQVYDVASMPGFRFQPTEEELVGFYLRSMVVGKPHLEVELINMLDLYRYDPWELPALAFMQGEREWLFFCPRDKKYPNGARPNRVTASGYWKATGTDRQVRRALDARCIGLKKTLVFYTGKAPKGRKTEWIMNEYRLPQHEQHLRSSANRNDPREVALCRIYKKPAPNPSTAASLGLCAELRMEAESSPAAALARNSKILHNTSTSEQQPSEATKNLEHRSNFAISQPETNPIQQEPPPIQTFGSRSAKMATGLLASILYPSPAAPAENNGDSIDALMTQMMEAEARRSRSAGPHFLNSPGTQIRVTTPDMVNTPRSFQDFAFAGEVVGVTNLTTPAMSSLDRLLAASTMRSTAPHDDHLPLHSNQFGWNFGTTSQPLWLNSCTLPSLLHIRGRQDHSQ